jgi:antitoxin component YwqK of YwqJK toxin-antitoxin module
METIHDKENELFIGQIVGKNKNFYQVRVDKVIHGNLASDTINLISGNGANCLQLIMDKEIGQTFMFHISNLSSDDFQYYGLLECGTSSLKLINNKLQGRISGGSYQHQEMLLSDFLEIYENKNPPKEFEIYDLTYQEFYKLNGLGQRIGKWKISGYLGLVIEEGEYNTEGAKTGKWTYMLIKENKVNGKYERETAIKKIVIYHNGLVLEVPIFFDESGNVLYPGNLKNGNGQLFEYFNTGEIYGKYTYKNGVKHGKAEEYKDDIILKGIYKNGKKEGTWKILEHGKLIDKEIYSGGKIKY